MFWSYFEWRHPLPGPSVLTWTKCPPFCESPAVMGPELIRNPVSWPKSLPKPQTRLPPNIALNSKNLSFSKSGLSPQEKTSIDKTLHLLLSVILARSAMTSSFSKTFLPARTWRPSEEYRGGVPSSSIGGVGERFREAITSLIELKNNS